MKIARFEIEEWMNLYEPSAKYDLSTTCISPLSIRELAGRFNSEILDAPLSYGEITGSDRLKNAIKELYSNQNTKNITVTHGAIGANQLVFLSLLEKGDEVVSVVPTYQQHYSIPESIGADVKLYFLKEKNNWLPDLDELDEILTSKIKLLCINSPNNPTGSVIPDWMLEKIVEIAKKKNIWILSDEVYRGLNIYGNPYSKSVVDLYDKGISVGSMSKTYSLPGLRVGWIVAREDLINEINHQRQYNTISVSIIDDYYASIGLENRDWISRRNFEILTAGRENLINWLKDNPDIDCVLPTSGTTVLLKYNKDIPSKELCKKLQEATGVALLPGSTMMMEGYVRAGFCSDNLKQGLESFSEYLNTL